MPPLSGFMWNERALEQLSSIPYKQRAQIIKKAKALMLDPHPKGSKKLEGILSNQGEAVYRQRSGDYRILYEIRINPQVIVTILDVGNRKDIYR